MYIKKWGFLHWVEFESKKSTYEVLFQECISWRASSFFLFSKQLNFLKHLSFSPFFLHYNLVLELEILRIQVCLQFVSSFSTVKNLSRSYLDFIFLFSTSEPKNLWRWHQSFTIEGTRKYLQHMNLRCKFIPGSSRNHTKKENSKWHWSGLYELLRGQLAALTKEVRRNQCCHPRNDDEPTEDTETDSHSNFSNPIDHPRRGVPRQVPGPPRGEPKWEWNFKIELPKFYGSLNYEEFIDWLNQVERIFDFHEVPA